MKTWKEVVIIQRRLPQYRKPFFERLKTSLQENQIDLKLIYGQPSRMDLLKGDNVSVDWGIEIHNKEYKIGKRVFIWQPCWKFLNNADLIIIEQASRLLLNYLLFSFQFFIKGKICLWGHGKNFQRQKKNKYGEKVKRYMSRKVHWWFAYNNLSADIVESYGFDRSKITSVQNALDNEESIKFYNEIKESSIVDFKNRYHIQGSNICLYSGSLYYEKRIAYLLECCQEIRSLIPDFEMIFIGSGPDATLIESASDTHPWIHYPGPVFGKEKVYFFKISRLLLMPGLVGLNIVDAFDFETPIVTTNISYHSPEIDYLESGINGIMVNEIDDRHSYARTVVEVLADKEYYNKLLVGCRNARNKYTMKEMVDRFSHGIINALNVEE